MARVEGSASRCSLCAALLLAVAASRPGIASTGEVLSHLKISDTEGDFTGMLDNGDFFGRSAAHLGDFDGDGVGDLAVGAFFDDDGGVSHGAVWILLLDPDGTVKSQSKISDTQGGFTGVLDDDDRFGWSVASLGDLDGDGVGDLAVGAHYDDDGGNRHGAVWILFLELDGTVKAHQKISDTEGGFTGIQEDNSFFGSAVASLGDLDGDGVGDLAVGAPGDTDSGFRRGAIWILFLESDGTVKAHQKISDTAGNFTGTLVDQGNFGTSLATMGDLDGDSVVDLAAGAFDNDGGFDSGSVWVLFLDTDGKVKSHQKISETQGGFTGILSDADHFGSSVTAADFDGDGVADLAVGATGDDCCGGFSRGAVWILFLDTDGTVKSHQKIDETHGNFTGTLDNEDVFGAATAALGNFDGNAVGDLAVGASGDDDGGSGRGAVWLLFLDGCDNGNVDPGEECDDGNTESCDGCSATCETEPGFVCGDGILNSDCEECDDGNDFDGDGCASDCSVEQPVPALSTWRVFVLLFLLLSVSTAVLLRRPRSSRPSD